jgi:hypothetical protein
LAEATVLPVSLTKRQLSGLKSLPLRHITKK